MAYVGISKQLIHEVRGRINDLKYQEKSSVPRCEEAFRFQGTEPWVQNLIWNNQQHLIAALPTIWFPKEQFRIRIKFGEGEQASSFDARSETSVPLPHSIYRSGLDVHMTQEMLEQIGLGTMQAERRLLDEIEERWNNVRKQVIQYLESCKSLNEALKLFPQMQVYIPADYIEKLNEKRSARDKVDSRALEALAAIDVDGVQAAFVSARLSGAKI